MDAKQMVLTSEQNSLYVEVNGAWKELDLVENVEVNEQSENKDIKPRRATRVGRKASLIGLLDFSGTITSYIPTPGVEGDMVDAYNAIKDAARKRTLVKLLFVMGGTIDSATALPATLAVCGVSRSRSEQGDDPTQETYNYSFMMNDFQVAPQDGTVQGGGFTPEAATVLGGSIALSGTASVGETLTVDVSGMTPASAQLNAIYKWYRNATQIDAADSSAYLLTAADQGAVITVKVAADGCNGTLTASTAGVVS